MADVIVRNEAFVNMLVSSLEVYKKEAYGILLGKRSGSDYIIRQAFTYQSAKRHYDWVVVDPKRRNRIDLLLRHLLKYQFIGDYHSHIDWPSHLSNEDKREMREEEIPLSLLLLVKDASRRSKWRFLASDQSLTGTVADRYFVKLWAFEYDPEEGRIRKLRVRCPFVKRLNRKVGELERMGLIPARCGRKNRKGRKGRKGLKGWTGHRSRRPRTARG
jgi:proteasome lid subunit RPN8/RPN11